MRFVGLVKKASRQPLFFPGFFSESYHRLKRCRLITANNFWDDVKDCFFKYQSLRIEFQDIQHKRLTVPENATVHLRSVINQTGCSKQDAILVVRKTNMISPLCAIYYVNKSCTTVDLHCRCEEMPLTSSLIHTVTRSDTGPWNWSVTADGEIVTETVYFNIIYPPRVKNLILSQSATQLQGPAQRNVPLYARCSIEDGNPPARTYIIHDTWNVSSIEARTTYAIPAPDCNDLGFLHCRAPGASANTTVPLLIRCPPMFNKTSVEHRTVVTGNNDLPFHIRSHTEDLHIASFIKTSPGGDGIETKTGLNEARLSSSNVSGCPPDLTVSVRLDNVRKQDQGTWRLTLTNDAGSGYMDVFLKVVDVNVSGEESTTLRSTADEGEPTAQGDQPPPTSTTMTQDHPTESFLASWMTACGAVVAAAVAVLFVACWTFRRQKGNKHRLPAEMCDACSSHTQSNFGSQADLLASRRLARSEECVMIQNFLYQRSASLPEIPEEDAHCRGLPKFDISNKPPAPLPRDLCPGRSRNLHAKWCQQENIDHHESPQMHDGDEEGDYAEVDEKAEEANGAAFSGGENDYVPIKDILERKQAQREAEAFVRLTRTVE